MGDREEQDFPQHRIEFDAEEVAAVLESVRLILASGRLTLGSYTEEFEARFAARVGRKWAVAVNSGTSALEIILRALRVAGAEVLVPSNTNFATGIAVVNAGGRLALYDAGMEATADEIERRLTAKVAAVVIVHIGGYISDEVERVRALCDTAGIALVEDAAHAHGTELRGAWAGSFGVAGAFSFVATKVMTTAEGGMIVTDDEVLARMARQYRHQGYAPDMIHHVLHGNSWRMTEIAAAMGLLELERLIERRNRMHAIVEAYARSAESYPSLQILRGSPGSIPSGYKCVGLTRSTAEKEAIARELRSEGVHLSRGVYDVPLHQQPVFLDCVRPDERFPIAEAFASMHVCLPLWRTMSLSVGEAIGERVATCLGRLEASVSQ
jgi:perosamine synthetase